MMNQGGSTETIAPAQTNSLENWHILDASQGQTSSYFPPTTGPEAISWTIHQADHSSTHNGILSSSTSTYQYDYYTQPLTRNVQDGQNAASVPSSSSSLGSANVSHDYNGYAPYPNSTDPYGSTGYVSYCSSHQQQQSNHSSYQQQQPNHSSYQQQHSNHSYSQPVGAFQNTGAPYQPLSSFQNTGSYAGPASYSSTYYNPGDYQTAGGYPSSGYSNQNPLWNDGTYTNYATHQYANYNPDSTGTCSSSTAPAPSLHYQKQCKQWVDYYGQTEVSCAPGTENISTANKSHVACPVPGVSGGYETSNSQTPPSYAPSWRPDSSSSDLPLVQPTVGFSGSNDIYWHDGAPSSQVLHTSPMQSQSQKPLDPKTSYDSFQDQQKTVYSQGPSVHYPATHQVPQSYQSPMQTVPSLDTQRVSKLQILTNPRIASNLTFNLPKIDKDGSATSAASKPAYVSVSLPTANQKVMSDNAADSVLKPGMFPKSLRGYVERALSRCKDDAQMTACQAVMKELITKGTADGTLYTRDWDIEPLFPLPNADAVNKDSFQCSTPGLALPEYKSSPSRRSKSRWEPLPEEKPLDKSASTVNNTVKYGGWMNAKERDRKPFVGNNESKENNFSAAKYSPLDQKNASKNTQRLVKKQRFADGFNTANKGDASDDSDKEQSLTAYYSSAIALANTPEERKRRENRSKRFEKRQGQGQAETNHSKQKGAGGGNQYSRRISALVLSKNIEDGGTRAVEDIDWDSLTVKGTCQEIEKRYLRLTSAPDPASVRPEEVLEKALDMVKKSQKNYLYKCDQLKSIRQDLTVQHIRNQLTVKVYETHARLALEVGDLPEYNQCQSQLQTLYAEGIEGCHIEFSAYHLLCVILHSNNYRDLLSSMSRLSIEAKRDEAVKHALAVRSAVTLGNYVLFFRLYKTAPNLNSCLMDLYVEKMRYKAVSCMSRSHRPTVPVSYIAQVLGFTTPRNEGSDDKDLDGLGECVDWLKAHGACLTADDNGKTQLDTKASCSSLYMPEPEDAVAHGDTNLAVDDFLTRTSL